MVRLGEQEEVSEIGDSRRDTESGGVGGRFIVREQKEDGERERESRRKTVRLGEQKEDGEIGRARGRRIIYLCTYNLYGAVRSGFDAGECLYSGKWEGVGAWKSRIFSAL